MLGERLKLARKKSGLSLRGLADRLQGQISAQAIGKYERDEMQPSSTVLMALCQALEVSPSYFLEAPELSFANVDFRKKARTTLKERSQVEAILIEKVVPYLQLEKILNLGTLWELPEGFPLPVASVQAAEKLAEQLRERWQLGQEPIANLTELLEEKGLKILLLDLPANVHGLTCDVRLTHSDQSVPVILINQKDNLERRRLTLAHELAHRLMSTQALSEKEEERAAQRIAGALLMPAAHLRHEMGPKRRFINPQEILMLKKIYRVSAAALLVRLRDLEIIEESTLSSLFQTKARTWRGREPEPLEPEEQTSEPGIRSGLQEMPLRFVRLCYHALAEDLISVTRAAEWLGVSLLELKQALRGQA
ncbi:MAG: helix-turn-helix domain-containing protein [Candidatus Sericytochromatia bacterium]